MLGHKKSLNNLRRLKSLSIIFSDHNGMKLEINCKNKTEKSTYEQHTSEQPMGQRRNKMRNKKNVKCKWKSNLPKLMGCSRSSSKREVHSDECLPQETSQISNSIMLIAHGTRRTNQVQVHSRKN